MSNFERAVANEAKRLRKAFADYDAPFVCLTITAEGACDHGELTITYSIAGGRYGDGAVSGGSVDQCVTEYFRRKGWAQANNPVAIPYFDPEN